MTYNYNRYPSNPVLNFLQGSVVKKIIVANVAVFLLQILLVRSSFEYFFALFPRNVITKGYVWQLVTYMFLHGGFFHIAFNMFIVWMFGTPLERTWGSDRFLKYYFVCGIGAALFSFIFAFNSAVIGASGAGYGILLAYAVLFPYNEVYVMGVFPVRARTLVIVLAVIEFMSGIGGRDGIAHFAHLGGMATGLLYLRTDHRTGRLWGRFRTLWEKFPIKIKVENKARKDGGDEEYDPGKIDSILDKISSKGYENLTETEKRILENYSKKTEKH
jgi:membrane associated rhomboid family serine protease